MASQEGVPRILVVDDSEEFIASFKRALGDRFIVQWATTPGCAEEILKREIVHTAIIDVALFGDSDEEGLKLAKSVDQYIPVILKSGQLNANAQRIATEAARRRPVRIDFWFTRLETDLDITSRIQAAVDSLRVNFDLRIQAGKGCGLDTVVGQIRVFANADAATRTAALPVVQDLLQKAFSKPIDWIGLERTTPGHGPCTIVKVSVHGAYGIQRPVAIKIGPRESIDREFENYERFVKLYIGGTAQPLALPVYSRELALLKYSFIGEDRDFKTLSDVIRTAPGEAPRALDRLFHDTCRRWYQGQTTDYINFDHTDRRWRIGGPDGSRLDSFYRRHLKLEGQTLIELKRGLDELIDDSKHFRRLDGPFIEVTVDRARTIKILDPLQIALYEKQSDDGSEFFPYPSRVCVMHGDLHGDNVIVDRDSVAWLLDFYKTGVAPAFLDCIELESDLKFQLATVSDIARQYEIEQILGNADTLHEDFGLPEFLPQETKEVLNLIKKVRMFAAELVQENIREYLVGLLFFAIRRIIGFVSSPEHDGVDPESTSRRTFALLSAGIICQRLLAAPAGTKGVVSVFVGHEYTEEQNLFVLSVLKNLLTEQHFELAHPLLDAQSGQLLEQTTDLIRNASMCLFELTDLNTNVCFELGYAAGCKRPFAVLVRAPIIAFKMLRQTRWLLYGPDASMTRRFEADLILILREYDRAAGAWFWLSSRFKEAERHTIVDKKSAVLITAFENRELSLTLLTSLIKDGGFTNSDTLDLEEFRDLGQLYLTLSKSGVLVACLECNAANRHTTANGQVALVAGMAHALGMKVIVLHQSAKDAGRGGPALADLDGFTRKFVDTAGARGQLVMALRDILA